MGHNVEFCPPGPHVTDKDFMNVYCHSVVVTLGPHEHIDDATINRPHRKNSTPECVVLALEIDANHIKARLSRPDF